MKIFDFDFDWTTCNRTALKAPTQSRLLNKIQQNNSLHLYNNIIVGNNNAHARSNRDKHALKELIADVPRL